LSWCDNGHNLHLPTINSSDKMGFSLLSTVLCLVCWAPAAQAFAPRVDFSVLSLLPPWNKQHDDNLATALQATPRGGGGGLFGRGGGTGFGKSSSAAPKKTSNNKPNDNLSEPDFSSAQTLMEIPATQIKVGPLRFLLQLFLAGDVANRPTPKSWFIAQRGVDGDEQDDNKQSIEVYYQDGSGMVTIELQTDKIVISRVGARPSLVYQLQESVLLHSVLDELSRAAFDQPVDEHGRPTGTVIEPSQRLLQLDNEKALEEARKTLTARAAAPSDDAASTKRGT